MEDEEVGQATDTILALLARTVTECEVSPTFGRSSNVMQTSR